MKTKRNLIILIVVLSVCLVATVTGVSVAYWIGAEGDNEIAPQTDTTDWNYWSKYFIYQAVTNEQGVVTGYKTIGFEGTTLENVVIPRFATGGRLLNADGTYTEITATNAAVLYVGNSTFANTTDKAIPVTLTLPTTVNVEAGAFAGLTNLTTIKVISVKYHTGNNYDIDMEIGSQAFAGCHNVVKFVAASNINFTVGGKGVNFQGLVEATGLPTDLEQSAR